MQHLSTILTGAAGLAMIVGAAAPAAAQYNQPNNNGGVVGAVINSVLGGGRYGAYGQGNDRIAVDQCARAAEARVSSDFRAGRYGAYNQGYGNYGNQAYGNQGYGNQPYGTNQAYAQARVVGITGVERRSNGLKVSGLLESGSGYPGAYNNQGYGNQPYGNQGYDPRYGNQGYGNQGYNAQSADLRFSCRVDYRGRITSLDIKRNNGRRI
jgi:hypothetical protein